MEYQNLFWTSDYISGIQSLIDVLEKGRLEGETTLSYLRCQVDLLELEASKLSQFIKSQEKVTKANISDETRELTSKSRHFGLKADGFKSLNEISKEQISLSRTFTEQKLQSISQIESNLLLRLSDFLEDYKTFKNETGNSLIGKYTAYKKALHEVESLKSKFDLKLRSLDDFTDSDSTPNLNDEEPSNDVERSNEEGESAGRKTKDDDEDGFLQFPLVVGQTTFEDQMILRDALISALNDIPMKRRMIPIPGINNEYFTSESLSKWIKENIPGEDSIRNIEKFGQDLINIGLVSNWNKLGHNTFVSYGGYYEFTDLARFVIRFEEQEELSTGKDDSVSSKSVPELTSTTSNTNKNSWKVWTSKLTGVYDVNELREQVSISRNQYFESVQNATTIKTELENLIITCCKKAQLFDTNRITLIYEVQKKLHEDLISMHNSQMTALKLHLESIKLDDDIVNMQLLSGVSKHSTGWYWPKSDPRFIDNNSTADISVLGVDLVSQYLDPLNTDMKTRSVPMLLFRILTGLEGTERPIDIWTRDIDISSANELKMWLLEETSQLSVIDPREKIMKTASLLFELFNAEKIVNFVKLWLLELPDGILPFTIYESLHQSYENEGGREERIQIIGTIPRQNLATLLLLLSQLGKNACKLIEDSFPKNQKIPLINILLRPPPKRKYLSIEDSFILAPLIAELLDESFQLALYKELQKKETHYEEKEKREAASIEYYIRHRKEPSPSEDNGIRSTSNHLLTADGLRSFKTSPRPSSNPSPVTSPSTSPKVERVKTHSRVSSLLSSPLVKRPSDNLPKRNSLIE